jgi:hypothetical protein
MSSALFTAANHRSSQIENVAGAFARGHAMSQLDDGPLRIAVQQEVGPAVDQERAPDLVRPVVVVGESPQAGLDATDHDGHVWKDLPTALGVHDRRPVRAFARDTQRRVGVVTTRFLVTRVVIHERVHVSAGHAEEQRRGTEFRKSVLRLPIGLIEDSDSKTVALELAPDEGHAETGMIDVRIAGHQHDVTGLPPERVHLALSAGQERRDAVALGPVGAMREQIGRGGH